MGPQHKGCIGPSKLEKISASGINMFDIPMKNMFHNELVTLSLGSRNKNVIKQREERGTQL